MNWSGTMTVNVTNQTNGPLHTVCAAHTWNGKTSRVGPQDLAPNASITFQVSVGGGGSDEWSIGFTDPSGNQYYRNGKQCNVEESDYKSKKPIVINLLPLGTGWSVELPESSSCTDNSYSRGYTAP